MPEVSIVTPTIGRDAALRRLLGGLETQDAQSFELIVACEEGLAKTVDAAIVGRRFPARVVRVPTVGAGASEKRNAGVRAAGAPLILFLDDDVVPRPDLVRQHLELHARRPGREVGVLGLVVWAPELRVTPFMRWLERGIQFDFGGVVGEDAGWQRLYTANASIKRELIEAVGGFDEVRLPYGYEDLDLAKRMHDEFGFRLLLNRDAVVEHLHLMTLESWRSRVTWVAEAERVFVDKHPEIRPYFHDLFASADSRPRASGRGRHLAWIMPEPRGWFSERVWRSADIWYRQQLAPHFLAAWEGHAPR